MRSWRIPREQAGDTIVEVLIAAAIVSSVLIGAFAVATRSTTAVRDSQEHSEMAQLLQGQVEGVRTLALAEVSDNTGVFSPSPKYFCVDQSSGNPVLKPQASLTSLPVASADSYTNYDAACKDLQGRYNVAITYDSASGSHVFTFIGRWDRLGGGKDEEQLSYRISAGSTATAAMAAAAPSPFRAARTAAAAGDTLVTAFPSAACYVEGSVNNYPDCYTFRVINSSDNPDGLVTSCTVNWGDGTPVVTYQATDPTCIKGNPIGPHTFPEDGTPTNKIQYKVVLTNYFKTGNPVSYPFAGIFVPR